MLTDARLQAAAIWIYRWRFWIMITGVTVLAGVMRFVKLGQPEALVFDEVYYPRGAYSLLQLGYFGRWTGENDAFAQGDFSGLTADPDRPVHPPLGWWMIAWGIKLFGANPFGWRFTAALFGTVTVIIVALIARKLFDSVLWGGVAGMLLAVDGEHVVMSRTGLLDIFLTFFVVVGFGLLVYDRHRTHRRLLDRLDDARDRLSLPPDAKVPGIGPGVGIRWYRHAALLSLGFGAGVKWNSLYFVAFFMILSVLWDMVDRQAAGIKNWFGSTVAKSVVPGLVATALIVPAAYTLTWANWFTTPDAYGHQWAERHQDEAVDWIPDDIENWVEWHKSSFEFHKNLTGANDYSHVYQAKPWSWTIQGRPTAFWYQSVTGDDADKTCGAGNCSSAISALGHPLIWWAGTAALGWAIFRSYARRDVLAGTVMIGVLAGWLPWFVFIDRIIFSFYTVTMAPFMVLLVAWAARRIAQPPKLLGGWSRKGGLVVGGFLAAVLILAGFFWPIWSGQPIPYDYWLSHMWWPTFELPSIHWNIGDWHILNMEGEKIGWV